MDSKQALQRKVRRQLLRELYYGIPPIGDTLETLNGYYGYSLTQGIYNVIMIRLTPKPDAADTLPQVHRQLDEFVCRLYADPCIDEFETLTLDGLFYIFFNFAGDTRSDSPKAPQVQAVTDALMGYLETLEGYHFVLGDGLPVKSVLYAGSCFRSAHKAVEDYSITLTTNRRYDSATHHYAMTQMLTVISPPRRASFAHALDTLQTDKLMQWVDEVFALCEPMLEQFPSIFYQLPYRIFDLCLDASSRTIASRQELQRLLLGCRAAIDESRSFYDAREATKLGLLTFCEHYAREVPQTGKHTVSVIRSYVREHYNRKLTLNEIAGHAGLTPQYLSVFFKKETGQSVVDFITTIRMDRAMELLRTSQLSVGEIARLVGYDDPNYFGRVFRRITNSTPRAYRDAQTKD